jgi:hypothetical protein
MVFVLSGTSWTRIGSGPPPPSRVVDLAMTPAGALCAAFGQVACMASPSPTGTAQVLVRGGGGNQSLAVVDGLLYMAGYADAIDRLDLAGPCWRPELPIDTTVFRMLVTPSSVVMSTNNGLLVQAR